MHFLVYIFTEAFLASNFSLNIYEEYLVTSVSVGSRQTEK